MLITGHASSDSLTLTRYEDGVVTIKVTGHGAMTLPEVREVPLAVYLRDIGIPFKAVRDVTRGEATELVPGD